MEFCRTSLLAEKHEMCKLISEERGMLYVNTSDEPDVMEGQGTLALELLDQVTDLDAILVPLGAGGMLSGVAVATKSRSPNCRVIAIEPEGKHLSESIRTGKMTCPNRWLDTMAEGIKG
jgi:threonine dehydratase